MAKIDDGLRVIIIRSLPRVHWQAIETGGTGKGIPDLNGCLSGVEAWIECKKADHWKPKIEAEQVGWIERRSRHGGRAFLAVRRVKTELWLLRPEAARTIVDGSALRDLPAGLVLGKWDGGPARWGWQAFSDLVFGSGPALLL